MVDHLGHGHEPAGKVTELKVPGQRISPDPHVHITLGTPENQNNSKYFIGLSLEVVLT